MLSTCGSSDISDGANVKKFDGVIKFANEKTIKIFASYISTCGGNQTDKLHVESINHCNKILRIMDGKGALSLYKHQYKMYGNDENIFITCANCLDEAIDYFSSQL